ncbi:WYL domain-containing protein [Lacrimispora amygdalina]|uniref:WYL domain-containing protein n=1 Tax=Lacrimispora amygdalina TaxID=253257 RepID=A0A3E2NA75_9FIRM|nr:WYL domain-containing protein [Clostridium indicum]RFZ77820.1 WYL domain-containing protein [Clostridium indicum]
MASSSNQKLKLLYLMKILFERTDVQVPMTIAEIVESLAGYDIKAERKSLYSDMELLRQFGVDIEMQRGKTVGYYIAERQFELPELKLLVDAVQSCRFITKRKSEELIKKLSSLTSSQQAKQLRRQVFVADRAKTINETVYYSIDQIHHAIGEGKKIAFQYFDYDVKKKRVFRRRGELYLTTPVSLCWNNDNYYLIAYSAKYDDFTHYRVDRMSGVEVLDEDGDSFDMDKFNIAEHAKRAFGMYDGELVRARLAFDKSLVNVVLDHFGKDVLMLPSTDGWFEISVHVSISPVFLAWVFQFGDCAEIKEPDSLIVAMRELAEKSIRRYSAE